MVQYNNTKKAQQNREHISWDIMYVVFHPFPPPLSLSSFLTHGLAIDIYLSIDLTIAPYLDRLRRV